MILPEDEEMSADDFEIVRKIGAWGDIFEPEASVVFFETTNMLRRLMCKLPKRHVDVLCLRFGLDGEEPKTLQEIGVIFGVGKEQIRRIQNTALRKLRSEIRRTSTALEHTLGGRLGT